MTFAAIEIRCKDGMGFYAWIPLSLSRKLEEYLGEVRFQFNINNRQATEVLGKRAGMDVFAFGSGVRRIDVEEILWGFFDGIAEVESRE